MTRSRIALLVVAAVPAALVAWNGAAAKIQFQDITDTAKVKVRHHTRVYSGPHADVLQHVHVRRRRGRGGRLR